MNAYLALGIAIVAEVTATMALKASDSFTRLLPSVIAVAGYAIAFYFLTIILRSVPTGIAYAIWSGLGIVLITLVSFVVYRRPMKKLTSTEPRTQAKRSRALSAILWLLLKPCLMQQ